MAIWSNCNGFGRLECEAGWPRPTAPPPWLAACRFPLGAQVAISPARGRAIAADVIGFRGEAAILLPRRAMRGVRPGDRVELVRTFDTLRLGPQWLGRVVSPQGAPLDGGAETHGERCVDCHREPPAPHERLPVDTPWGTGIRVIDALLTCGRGQRIALLAGPGVGKSALLGMLARHSTADVNVVGLIGERGREVNEFVARDLGEGLARSVVVAATSDETAAVRLRAAHAAIAAAEHFRDAGQDVLLLIDSLTRVCHSQREIGLSLGETGGRGGYPPSVLSLLPRLIERTGRTGSGSITAVFTVLVEQDDPADSGRRRCSRSGGWPLGLVARAGRTRALPGGRRVGQPQPADAASGRSRSAGRRATDSLVACGADGKRPT